MIGYPRAATIFALSASSKEYFGESHPPGTQELHDSGYAPLAGHALERVSAAVLELKP